MSVWTIVLAILLGVSAGLLSGLFGVGGGILFVPTLLVLGLTQLDAQGTSLLAILPTVVVGALTQRRYGNLRARPALVIGFASVAGVEVGARLVTHVPEHLLRKLFGLLLFGVATQLVLRTRRRHPRYPESS